MMCKISQITDIHLFDQNVRLSTFLTKSTFNRISGSRYPKFQDICKPTSINVSSS